MPETKDVLIKVRNLKTYYPVKQGVFKHTVGHVKAVDDVSLDVYRGEILGVVGESGCGKTTLGKSILQLIKPTEGSIRYAFEGGEKELIGMNKKELDEARCKMQIVFQDPYSSLNPSFTIFGSMQEPLIRFGEKSRKARREKIAKLLEAVNLPADYMERYPNEFSGGQRQRIGIARALSVSPEFIVCDEAVSALDVSIQAQVLQLLKKLQEERGLTYMFITHDLSVVEYISDRIVVMYLGRMVEMADTQELFENTLHPYTRALLSAIPIADIDRRRKRIPLQGDVPSPVNPPSGCPFHPRCPECMERCKTEVPHPMIITRDGREHMVCCHRVQANAGGGNDFKTHI
ncbi:ABC transporter ATP-binding protein [Enterocloster bolteae]|uniref:ABC transporter ATP-binding protein n=1 Tax=Enterocloster bolteae TaxID=208479 RepID=UPI000E44BD4F|nr:ABC transporter ATP-binding protein [Enterocloster bolteae]RGK72626.1 ABC transporter ATP-binding protein [Enterocloster bolteae]